LLAVHHFAMDIPCVVTPKSKLLVLNNPQNVPGKVYSRAELESLAEFVKRHDLFVLSDEVYEWLTYDQAEQIRFASLPGMFERTGTSPCG
jgi:aspartate/methionine/tyrosine aminotransferase